MTCFLNSRTLRTAAYACLFICLAIPAAQAETKKTPTIVSMRVGLNGAYKLGCWTPVEVDLLGGTEQFTGLMVVNAPDADGVPTTVVSPPSRPVGVTPGELVTARLYVRVGRTESQLRASFVAGGKVLAKRTFDVGPEEEDRYINGGMSASSKLIVQFGAPLGIGELVKSDGSDDQLSSTFVTQLNTAEQLPTQWYGYDGVDTVLLTTSQVELYRPLIQNTARVDALREWVERGGKLALFCGQQAEELLAEGGVLADFVPGSFESLVPLRQSVPIESFSGSDAPLTKNRRVSLQVPKLTDVEGSVLAYSGSEETELPLVVRSRLGLGEVVFVGLDFDRQPFSDWKGRESFLRKALDWPKPKDIKQQPNFGFAQQENMVTRLRDALDSQFEDVTTVPFFFVGVLVVAYILLIGPGDYFLVSRVLKKNELTWITFPLMVIAVSVGAYGLANWLKGDQFRVNQVEIVDVDTAAGQARGTVWTHFFTPRVDTFDLSIDPVFLDSRDALESTELVSWLGMPGYAMGGMQVSQESSLLGRGGYRFSEDLSAMNDLPVQLWSTKTLAADWLAEIESPLVAQLKPDGDELLSGQLTNNSSVLLEDSLLCYGTWAYYLGRITPDAVVTVDDNLQPRTVKTSLTTLGANDTGNSELARGEVARLLKSMMFFEAINGEQYTGATNEYQANLDLSHLLKQKNVAILLAKVSVEGTKWMDEDVPLESDADRRWTYYRFLLPVTETNP